MENIIFLLLVHNSCCCVKVVMCPGCGHLYLNELLYVNVKCYCYELALPSVCLQFVEFEEISAGINLSGCLLLFSRSVATCNEESTLYALFAK